MSIVRDIMSNHPRALKIERELVDDKLDLLQTAAGAELNAGILAERRKKDEKLAEA